MYAGSHAYIIWAAFSLHCPHQHRHTIIFSTSPSSSNLTVMVQRGLRLDLPSGPGISLKYLPGSHFNPHLNTSGILGHYSGSVCPARLSLRLVCARVSMVVKVTPPGWIPLYPGVTLAFERCSAHECFDLSGKNIAAVAITPSSFYFCPVHVHYS